MDKPKVQPKVIVFTSSSCSYCNMVKRYLRDKHIRFKEINIEKDSSAARDLARRGHRGVPVTLINNRSVVGFNKQKINRLLDIH